MARTMPPDTVEDFANGLSDRTLACRELGHHWRPMAVTWERKARAYHRTMRCPGCRTERVQVLTESGHVVSNHYRYPDGYLATGVARGVTRDAFRAVALRRFLDAHAEREQGAA